jgi:hypothetical protein
MGDVMVPMRGRPGCHAAHAAHAGRPAGSLSPPSPRSPLLPCMPQLPCMRPRSYTPPLRQINDTIETLKFDSGFPADALHTVAVKANPVGRVLRLFLERGMGAEVGTSGGGKGRVARLGLLTFQEGVGHADAMGA